MPLSRSIASVPLRSAARPAGRIALYGLAALSFAIWGCAGNAANAPRPYIEARSQLYVGVPAVPAEVDSLLGPRGWVPGRFASELRRELRFQLNRLGVSTPDDSAVTQYRLELSVDRYQAGSYAGLARIATPAGRRDIGFRKPLTGNAEREDPTLDDIRMMAKEIAGGANADPRRKREDRQKYHVDPMMSPLM